MKQGYLYKFCIYSNGNNLKSCEQLYIHKLDKLEEIKFDSLKGMEQSFENHRPISFNLNSP